MRLSAKNKLHTDTAWTLCHRLREAMRLGPYGALLAGNVVVADETYIGGSPKNRHANDPRTRGLGRNTGRTLVLSLIDGKGTAVRSRVLSTPASPSLARPSPRTVDMATTELHSDKWPPYEEIGKLMAAHHAVDHGAGQYVTEKSHGTNKAENYFSQLKRSLDGTHHHVSPAHLHRYLAEFDYRFSTREMTDGARMERLLVQSAGRRLAA